MKKSNAIKKEIVIDLYELREERKEDTIFFEAIDSFSEEGSFENGSICHFDVSDYDEITESTDAKIIADVLKEYGITGECVLYFSW